MKHPFCALWEQPSRLVVGLMSGTSADGVDAVLTPTFDDAEAYLRAHWHAGDLMISHGCGDIDLLNEQIAAHGDTQR